MGDVLCLVTFTTPPGWILSPETYLVLPLKEPSLKESPEMNTYIYRRLSIVTNSCLKMGSRLREKEKTNPFTPQKKRQTVFVPSRLIEFRSRSDKHFSSYGLIWSHSPFDPRFGIEMMKNVQYHTHWYPFNILESRSQRADIFPLLSWIECPK